MLHLMRYRENVNVHNTCITFFHILGALMMGTIWGGIVSLFVLFVSGNEQLFFKRTLYLMGIGAVVSLLVYLTANGVLVWT
jgi:hypothetical protein